MEDRKSLNEKLLAHKYFPPFFSVLLPELGRPEYLKKCVEHLHQYADMPIEIIVHDDGSGAEKQQQLVDIRDKISTLMLHTGHNTGLARSFNRCRAMASSPYLFGMNTDTYITSRCLRNVKSALDLPYVGVVNLTPPGNITEGPGTFTTKDGVKIMLSPEMGSFHAAGVRAEVWDKIGGWNENVQTTSSDVGFLGEIFGAGYFSVLVEGTQYNEMWKNDGKINIKEANPDYIGAACFTRQDVNMPPIFNMPGPLHDECCAKRWHDVYEGVNSFLRVNPNFESWHNTNFIVQEMNKLFPDRDVKNIDWDFAETYGHARWKDQIKRDFQL